MYELALRWTPSITASYAITNVCCNQLKNKYQTP
jgi:hypothetical protein